LHGDIERNTKSAKTKKAHKGNRKKAINETWAPAEFFPGVGKLGGLEMRVPSGVQGLNPGGSLG